MDASNRGYNPGIVGLGGNILKSAQLLSERMRRPFLIKVAEGFYTEYGFSGIGEGLPLPLEASRVVKLH